MRTIRAKCLPGHSPFGPIIEEGLIIGFSILALLVIVSIIISVLDWSQGMVNDFLQDLGG